MKEILILCTGNICRSPMAEGLFKKQFSAAAFKFSSAGLRAMVNSPAALDAQLVMQSRNIDISHHRAKQINQKMLLQADLIFVMEQQQKQQLEFDLPVICGRVLRLGQWLGFDIPDPYRRNIKAFEQTLILLEACIKKWEVYLS